MTDVSQFWWQALHDAGLAPPWHVRPEHTGADEPIQLSDNLLIAAHAAWTRVSAAPSPDRSHGRRRHARAAERHVRQLAAAIERGERLVPLSVLAPTAPAHAWVGPRLAWWTGGEPAGRRVAIVSSRLPRLLAPHGPWLRTLRTAIAEIDASREAVLIVAHTAGARLVDRAAELRGLRRVRIAVTESGPLSRWATRLLAGPPASPVTATHDVSVSPCLGSAAGGADEHSATIATPARDRVAIGLADTIVVLHIRPRGHLHALLRERVIARGAELPRVFLPTDPALVRPKLRDELVHLGAVPIERDSVPAADAFTPKEIPPSIPPQTGRRTSGRSGPPVPHRGDGYLIHCTRACPGPWPGQAETEYLDDLILARPGGDHSAAATLRRIVAQRRLDASSRAIRGGFHVVSFTAAPLGELASLRVFRPHRGRWDFEPYGIAIRREWLIAVGARPVQYGDEAHWVGMPAADRPFFQCVRATARPGQSSAIDWSVEREWRIVGHVPLDGLPSDAAFVFVPSAAEAAALRSISPWPVVVLNSD